MRLRCVVTAESCPQPVGVTCGGRHRRPTGLRVGGDLFGRGPAVSFPLVSFDDQEDVRLHVTAFSRPVAWYARLGRPITRALQLAMARTFLRVLAE